MGDRKEPTAVRTQQRGLQLLIALNRRNFASATQLARDTGLPRATACRLLEGLIDAGFVARVEGAPDAYCLTSRVRELSSGFDASTEALETARPFMRAFSAEVGWPTALMLPAHGAMVLRGLVRTPRWSAYPRIGDRFDLLGSSSGRAMVASIDEAGRRRLIDEMLAQRGIGDPGHRERHRIHALVRDAAILGCGFREGELRRDTASIALPIRHDGQTVACWAMVFRRSAMSVNRALDAYLPRARSIVRQIEEHLVRA